MHKQRFVPVFLIGLLLIPYLFAACGSDDEILTVYSGRSESLVQPLLDQFAAETGIEVQVKYGKTAGTVALLLEEGKNTPADVVYLQDAGALGALALEGALTSLDNETLSKVNGKFKSRSGKWVGTSGRARTVVYNVDAINPEDLPSSILGFTDAKWHGRIGWAPANGSFQAFVTALRIIEGETVAGRWLEGIKANDAVDYPKNTAIVEAVGRGEVDLGFVNHYYLLRFLAEQGDSFPARNFYLQNDSGALINVAGAGILDASKNKKNAQTFIEYLLSESAQRYFAETTYEYPLAAGVDSVGAIPSLADINPPEIDLGSLEDLRGTLSLMREAGVIP